MPRLGLLFVGLALLAVLLHGLDWPWPEPIGGGARPSNAQASSSADVLVESSGVDASDSGSSSTVARTGSSQPRSASAGVLPSSEQVSVNDGRRRTTENAGTSGGSVSRFEPRHSAEISDTLVNPRIVIHKSLRRLDLYSGDRLYRQYSVSLGRNPVGAKERQGDGRTPEGDYFICIKNPNSQFGPAMGISYPGPQDGEAAFKRGLIGQVELEQIRRAHAHRTLPPWYTILGGEIFIHGGGVSGDWTRGSISLRRADAQELFDAVPEGTAVTILP